MTDGNGPPNHAAYFYGWRVVAAVFVMLSMSSGLGFYNLSVFVHALTSEGRFSIDTASNATSLFFLVGAGSGLAVGKMIDRFDPRYTICAGAFLAAAGLTAIGRAGTPAALFASYVLFAVGFSCTSIIPATILVARWFSRRRAFALAVASSGLSLGGIVVTPVAAAIIGDMGLAPASRWLAIVYVIAVVPVAIILIRRSPQHIGLEPDGARPKPNVSKAHLSGATFSEAVKSRFFILCTAAFVLIMLAQVGGLAHQFNLIARRLDSATAATAVASMAGASMIGRFIGGWAISRYSIRPVVLSLVVLQASSLMFLGFSSTVPTLLTASTLLGLALGNLLMALPLALADAFGMRDYGRIYATSQATTQLGIAAGPALVGLLYGLGNGYGPPLAVISGLALVGGVLFYLAGPVPTPDLSDVI